MKFRSLQHAFLNKNVNIKLILKLFNAAVTPSLVYSLETCPLTQSQMQKLDIVQRKMLRKMVGWVFDSEDTWEDAGRRMKLRLQTALNLHPIDDWSAVINKRKQALLHRIMSDGAPRLPKLAFERSPVACSNQNNNQPCHQRGHPRRRWHDHLL